MTRLWNFVYRRCQKVGPLWREPCAVGLRGAALLPIVWHNWGMRLREFGTLLSSIPPFNWFWWALRTIPLSTGVVVVLCVIHGAVALVWSPAAARGALGLTPGFPLSWFTHAFLHADVAHLALNCAVFWASGGLVELCLGRGKLAVLVLVIVPAAAVMSAMAVPEYWKTHDNPIGFSAVSEATFVLGVYLGAKVFGFLLAGRVPDQMRCGSLQVLPWSLIGTVAALAVTLAWLHHGLGVEWTSMDAAPRVAHSFGMLSGLTAAGTIAVTGADSDVRSLSRSSVVLAGLVIIVVAVEVVL